MFVNLKSGQDYGYVDFIQLYPFFYLLFLYKKVVMNTKQIQFNEIVEKIYNLPLEIKKELKNLLEKNIADERRDEIAENLRLAKKSEKDGSLTFFSNVIQLKQSL